MSDKKKVCIACGGSAGHIFPGLSLAEELAKRYGDNVEISFLTSDNKLARSLFTESGFNFYTLPLKGLKRGTMRENLSFVSSLFKGTCESIKLIFSNRPDCFVGFGSYIAGPPFVIASLLGVPTLIHEQNVVMGKANRIMRHFAKKVALSFPKEIEHEGENVVFTGNPIRESAARILNKRDAIDSLGMNHDKFTILIIGGSQGSQTINSVAVEMFQNMDKQLRDRIQVIHISGENDCARLKKIYRDIDILCKLHPFFKDMGVVYSATDISISRAGASVIHELCTHRIPSILIPYPFAEGHQFENAEFLAAEEAAIILEEEKLSSISLFNEVERLMKGREFRESMRRQIGSLATSSAAKNLADEVSSLLL